MPTNTTLLIANAEIFIGGAFGGADDSSSAGPGAASSNADIPSAASSSTTNPSVACPRNVADVLIVNGVVQEIRLLPQVRHQTISKSEVAEIAGSAQPKANIGAPIDVTVIDAAGGALLPGLCDHHIHLLSLAESLNSVQVGPPAVRDVDTFRKALRSAGSSANRGADGSAVDSGAGSGAVDGSSAGNSTWIRAVGYHESVAGELGFAELDGIVSERPVRVQHDSGAMWILNSRAIQELGITESTPGAECDSSGKLTGRLFRNDAFVYQSYRQANFPKSISKTQNDNLRQVSKTLAGFGVTAVTDATPGYGKTEVRLFTEAVQVGALSQAITLMTAESSPLVNAGPHKIILSDHKLPSFESLAQEISVVHEAGRAVAVHSVTRASLALLVAVLEEVGAVDGDRVEHASICPPELMSKLAQLQVRAVLQPHFITERGDRYLREVEADDLKWLYRCQGFREAGVRVAGGTDAPFGSPNPWKAIWAATNRHTQPGNKVIGGKEVVSAEQALALFLSPPHDPGGATRQITPGAPADLCLLNAPWQEVVKAGSENPVSATFIAGKLSGF